MKQRVAICLTTPSGSYRIKIQSVHQDSINNRLIAVSELICPRGMMTSDVAQARDAVIVKTSTNHELPVVHYLVGRSISEKDEVASISTYGRQINMVSGDESTCLPIGDVSEISAQLTGTTCVYKPRTDGLVALRVSRHENAWDIPAFGISNPTDETKLFRNEQMQSILNVFATLDDDTLKIVFETVTAKSNDKSYKDIKSLFNTAVAQSGKRTLSLTQDLLMSEDDKLHLDTTCANVKTSYVTEAVEFSIPTDHPKAVMDFLGLIDTVVANAKTKAERDYRDAYQIVQISEGSILSCFHDIFVSNLYDRNTGKQNRIENPMPISIENFLNRPGTVHDAKSVAQYILDGISNSKQLTEYANLREVLNNHVKPIGLEGLKDESKFLGSMFNVDMNKLFGNSTTEEKLKIVDKLEKFLLDDKRLITLSPFVEGFNAHAISELMKPAMGKRADDGGQYNARYTEFSVLLHADFCIRDDGRMSIELQNNAGYQKHYGKNARLHGKCEQEFRFLANVLGLEFAAETNFHQEMIFTPESTLKLKALGLHINTTNLMRQLHPELKSVSASGFTFFGNTKKSAKNNDSDEDISLTPAYFA